MRECVKTTIKVFVLLGVAAITSGYCYTQYQAKEPEFEETIYHEHVHAGDTFEGIIRQYYNPYNEVECWDEWKTIQKKRNKVLFRKMADGKQRVLQVADIVCIKVRERVK